MVGLKATYIFGLFTFGLSMLFTVLFPSVVVLNICAAFSGVGFAVATTIPCTLITKYHEQPEIFLTEGEKEYYGKIYDINPAEVEKPIMAIQTNGGILSSDIYPGYNWARDLPQEIIVQLIEEYRDSYNIVHIKRPDQQGYPDTFECVDTPRGVAYMLLTSEKRVFIDSFAQHMAAALNLPSTVCWVTTNPIVFGYDIHDNIFANSHKKEFITNYKTFSQYELNEGILDFPWDSGEDVFDINKIFQSINKN